MKDRTIGVDLAKNVFEIGISDRPGHVKKTCRLSRAKFLKFFVDQVPSRVVMEACGSSHYWAREITKLGHEVKLASRDPGRDSIKDWVSGSGCGASAGTHADVAVWCGQYWPRLGMAPRTPFSLQVLQTWRARSW